MEERQLLIQAGVELASQGGNAAALRFFKLEYLAKSDWSGCLRGIPACGLPTHTSPTDEELRVNEQVASGIFSRDPDHCPYRRLALLFDRTYLVQGTSLAQTTRGHVLVGGAWRHPSFEQPDEAQMLLKDHEGNITEQEVKRNRTKANELESILLIDPTRKSGPSLEIAALPVTSAAPRHCAFEEGFDQSHKFRGCWECLFLIGRIMEEANSVKYIIADGHGSHRWAKMWLSGKTVPISQKLREQVPFFNRVQFTDVPEVQFPLGIRIARVDSMSVHWINGVAHAQKNFVSQLRGCISTIHFGQKWVDGSAMVQMGLVPPAFIGTDSMSDAQAALWLFGSTLSHCYFQMFGETCVLKTIFIRRGLKQHPCNAKSLRPHGHLKMLYLKHLETLLLQQKNPLNLSDSFWGTARDLWKRRCEAQPRELLGGSFGKTALHSMVCGRGNADVFAWSTCSSVATSPTSCP